MSHALRALGLIGGLSVGALLGTSACAERVADCVEVYPNTGATRRPGFTRTGCQDHCAQVQGWIDCYWDGRIAAITGPSVTVTRQEGN